MGCAMRSKIRVAIPSAGCDGGRSGIGTYLENLLACWAGGEGPVEFELVAARSDRDWLKRFGMETVWLDDMLASPMANLGWMQAGLPALCKSRGYDAVFFPAGNRRLSYSLPCASVGTVHDLSSLHVKAKYDRAHTFYNKRVLPVLIRRLSHVVTVSETSKKDIVRFVGVSEHKVSVIPNAVDHSRFRARSEPGEVRRLRQRIGCSDPYIVYVSRFEHPGKNHIALIQAFGVLKAETGCVHKLVLAGSDWSGAEKVHAAVRASAWGKDILLPGFLDAAMLPALYRAADLLVFPSLYEGFGIPVLEAMASGLPVACANNSSLPEVAADAAEYFDPTDVGSIAAAMRRVIADADLRRQMVKAGLLRSAEFSWEKTAAETLAVILRAMGGHLDA